MSQCIALTGIECLNIHPLTAMTKAEEMQRYDQFVKSLPEDSYLRPWLKGIRDLVETDLRNDIFPEFTPSECWEESRKIIQDGERRAKTLLETAESKAATLMADATAKAATITERAEANAEATRRELRDDIHRLRHALNAVA